MSWRFRKIFNIGPIRTSVSKKGIGASWGFRGFRFGVSPDGRKYFSIGIPGTGLYLTKYLNTQSEESTKENSVSEERKAPEAEKRIPWWKQKGLK